MNGFSMLDCSRKWTYRVSNVATSAGSSVLLVKKDPTRWGWLCTDSGTSTANTFSVDTPILGALGHYFQNAELSTKPVYFSFDKFGPIVQSAWYVCRTVSGVGNVGVIEILQVPGQ